MPGLAGLGEPSAALRDWDRGCGRPSHARAGSRRLPGFRRTGRAARGRRERVDAGLVDVDAKHGATMCDEVFSGHQPRRLNRAGAAKVGDLDRRGQPEVPSGRSRLAGRAPSKEPSWGCLSRWRLRNRTPQRRANASASAWFRTPRRAARSSFLRCCWKSELRRRYSQAKPGASSDRSSSYAPGVPPVGAAHRRRLHWQVADQSACRDDKREGGGSVRPGAATRVAVAARNGIAASVARPRAADADSRSRSSSGLGPGESPRPGALDRARVPDRYGGRSGQPLASQPLPRPHRADADTSRDAVRRSS